MAQIVKNFWDSQESHLFCNTAYTLDFQQHIREKLLPLFPSHIWISTSGSYTPKWVALSKAAILHSAHTVNQHLNLTSRDVWVNPLPLFHIGGLSITARGHLNGAKVYPFEEKWNPQRFCEFLKERAATITSLVPTQLFDLVKAGLFSPSTLHTLLIGGGALSDSLYTAAKNLGWPVTPTFGMSEVASQVATATRTCSHLQLLPHIEAKVVSECLAIRSPALMTTYATLQDNTPHCFDPKEGGWLLTEDRVILNGRRLIPLGRAQKMIKIGGENVDLTILENLWETITGGDPAYALIAEPDERLGFTIQLLTTKPGDSFIEIFNKQVLPFERIRSIQLVPHIPRSPLGKLLRWNGDNRPMV